MDKHQQIKKHVAKQQSDGKDIQFSQKFADHDDLEALARLKAADERAKRK